MPRTLLINRQHGTELKTYGVKKVQTNMKFSFIICVVTVFLYCGTVTADTRILKDLKYLEYLNDLDRRNVELDDIHKQWPFADTSRNLDDGSEDEIGPRDEKIFENERFRYNPKYHGRFLEKFEDGVKHLKETLDRANHLSQYRRYKPIEQEILEEARMYPERNDEEPVFNDEAYQNPDVVLDDEGEELTEAKPSLARPFFIRIATVDKPFIYKNKYPDSDTEPQEILPKPRPTFPKAYFPRVAPVDIPVNYKIEGLEFGIPKSYLDDHDMHHGKEDYKFKDNEKFPHSGVFDEAPVVEDPGEFGIRPTDPRFYRDLETAENKVTLAPKQEDSVHPYLVKSPYVSKPKMNSRSDLQKQGQSLPNDELQLESFANKDVEVIPFKPDAQEDTAGVYIIAIIAGISAAATVGLIAVGIGWYNLQKHMKNAEDTDYPSYGIVGPNKEYEKKERDDAGDRRLAQSAQMYHYQHQKQQIIAMGRNPQGHGSQSDTEEEEDEEGNYTVYECPGLASIEGPLEVKNPMFDDEQLATPSQTPSKATNGEDTK